MMLISNQSFAKKNNSIQRKSQLEENSTFGPDNSSFPQGFTEIGQPADEPAVSTGYYFVDSDDEAPSYWRPAPGIVDTATQPNTWHRILQGPRILPRSYWDNNPDEGHRFFHNPASIYGGEVDFFDNSSFAALDSADNAFAGPIPIGFGFYFNGLRYDSFYVTTNGLIALTNRRYFYDSTGERTIPSGRSDCYDPMSMDWFVRAKNTSNGTGLDDPTEDNFGYLYSVLGNSPGTYLGGIRTTGGSLNSLNPDHKAAVLSPFWGDNQLSQYYTRTLEAEDFGKCYYKRDENIDKLIIYYVNIAPVNSKVTPYGNYNAPYDLRSGDDDFIAASAQIVLDGRDSSVTFVYERFDGIAIVNNRPLRAGPIFRYNTTSGVRGFARHVDYGQTGGTTYPWAKEYEQYTHYFDKQQTPFANYPHNQLAVKFKQWKNTLRVVDLQYRVRKQQAGTDLNFTEAVSTSKSRNYELLAGEVRIGAVQPVVIIQNMSNGIQGTSGVNFIQQAMSFKVRVRIVNTATGRQLYNRWVPVDSTCLASSGNDCTGNESVKVNYVDVSLNDGNYTTAIKDFPGSQELNGIPPYGFAEVFLPPFEPNVYTSSHIGRIRVYAIAEPINPQTGTGLGDEWPFDDTLSLKLFVMKRLDEFNDDATEYHFVERIAMPSVNKWVNIDAGVVSGGDVSGHPLPPRGSYAADNNANYTLSSPVIRMTRKTLWGKEPATSPGGDELRSFPIDLTGKYNSVLSLSIQRTASKDDWPRGWSDKKLIGPEPRTIVNGDIFNVWTRNAFAASAEPDELEVEFARPSPDGIRYITNISNDRWRYHTRRGGAAPVTDMAALTLYGGGGYMTGFLESDKDSALSQPSNLSRNGLRANIYDDGIDNQYKRYFIAIPDTIINAPNDGAKNFRFRIRVSATDDRKCETCIPDDDDEFFVDNIRILEQDDELTDLEISSVVVDWPYTMTPASQANKIPVNVTVANNTYRDAPAFVVRLFIWKKNEYRQIDKVIACGMVVFSGLNRMSEITKRVKTWNARLSGPGEYRLEAIIQIDGGDLVSSNDTTFTDFTVRFGDVFAYGSVDYQHNDVPNAAFSNTPGRGLNLEGYATGGRGNISRATSIYTEGVYGAGYVGGSGAGQIAMKFIVTALDTIKGYQSFVGLLSTSWDDISFAIYRNSNDDMPGTMVQRTQLVSQKGYDGIRNNYFLDEYVTALLDTPVTLTPGTYWLAVTQLGQTGLELGASKSRMGMRTTNISIPPPTNTGGEVGGSGSSLLLEKTFRTIKNGLLVNKNLFAFKNISTGAAWKSFSPTVGNPAYAHLHHFGISREDNKTATLSRGGWIPLIRPYFGEKTYRTVYDNCLIPVEMIYFTGDVRSNGISLEWAAASEENNYGYYIEKRVYAEPYNNDWEDIGFVSSAGNSSVKQEYNYLDDDVQLDILYQYRLRQVDFDGTADSVSSGIVTLKFAFASSLDSKDMGQLELLGNKPNPFNENTTISFYLPSEEFATLEIVDIYGNVINSLSSQTLFSGKHQFNWDGKDDNGISVASGNYICRLLVGGKALIGKMVLIR